MNLKRNPKRKKLNKNPGQTGKNEGGGGGGAYLEIAGAGGAGGGGEGGGGSYLDMAMPSAAMAASQAGLFRNSSSSEVCVACSTL